MNQVKIFMKLIVMMNHHQKENQHHQIHIENVQDHIVK